MDTPQGHVKTKSAAQSVQGITLQLNLEIPSGAVQHAWTVTASGEPRTTSTTVSTASAASIIRRR